MNDAELISAVVIAIVAFVYLTIVRPSEKEKRQHRQQMRDLRPGDQVLTTSNFIGLVRDIQVGEDGQSRITLELGPGVTVTALPNAILRPIAADKATGGKSESSEQKGASA
jgi:preprotein translocase YajC subunit